jgi:pSer/pThr/pTyr-binding forkhead associated (FHA) protein
VDREGSRPLCVGIHTLGRACDNDVVVDSFFVSRIHCAIVVHADHTCELHDIASRNGTYLNGRRLQSSARLTSGDEIALGSFRFLFLSTAGQPDPSCTLLE